MVQAHETRVRELSPWSARRALTEQMNQDQGAGHLPPPTRKDNPPRKKDEGASPKVRRSREPSTKAMSVAPQRDPSPEPYRKPRDSEKRDSERRDRSRDRDRNRDRDSRRDKSRDRRDRRDRDSKREERRDRSKDSKRDDRDRSRERRDRSRDRRRDRDRERRRHRSRSPRSPPPKRRKHGRSPSASRSPSPHRRSKAALPPQEISFRGTDNAALPPSKYGGAPAAMEKPNFKTTGALAKAANKVEGTKISLKYHEPAEARKPSSKDQWKIVVFKGDDVVDTIELHTKSCWLFGRSVEVVDYVLEHPSSSGQHAVIQFRYIQKTVEDEFGVKKQKGRVKPYVIDLESSNGTELNGERIETSRYMELRHKDTLMFAGSEREYVVILPPPESKAEASTG